MHTLLPLLLAFASLSAPLTPGSDQRGMLTLPGDSGVRYAISVPEGYDGNRDVPLVLALHFGWGGGAVPPDYSATFMRVLVEPGLRELGAVIVAPLIPARSWTDPTSEAAVMALLDRVRSEYRIDAERVVVTGFSLGGMGTWYFASRHADILSAAIPMASVPIISGGVEPDAPVQRFLDAGSVEWPPAMLELPIYAIHSSDDELLPIGPVEKATDELKTLGSNVEFTAIDAGIGHHETSRYVPYLAAAVPWIRDVWARKR